MPRPPGEPGFFDKTNYVIDSWARPCDAPWYIYVETLWPAALEAFITLATFGWDDVARGYWRPRGLGRRTGKKPGKGRRRPIRFFPELGEEIGKRIPTADIVKGRKWNAAGKALWRIDLAMQQVLFWWLVADVTNDFAYNFTTMLYETRWCQASNLGRFSYQDVDGRTIPGGGWWLPSYEVKDYQFAPPSYFIISGGTGSKSCLVTAATAIEPIPGRTPPTSVQVRIVNRTTGEVWAVGSVDALQPDGTGDGIVMGNVPAHSVFSAQVMHDGQDARIFDGIITAMENDE